MTRLRLQDYQDANCPIPLLKAQDKIKSKHGATYPAVQSKFIAAAWNFRFDPHTLPSLLYMHGTLTPVTKRQRMSHALGRSIDSRVLVSLFCRTMWSTLTIGHRHADGTLVYPKWSEVAQEVDQDGDCYDAENECITVRFRRSIHRLTMVAGALKVTQLRFETEATRGKSRHADGTDIAQAERKWFSEVAIKGWDLDFLLSLGVVTREALHNFIGHCATKDMARVQKYYQDHPEIVETWTARLALPGMKERAKQALARINHARYNESKAFKALTARIEADRAQKKATTNKKASAASARKPTPKPQPQSSALAAGFKARLQDTSWADDLDLFGDPPTSH